jgi:hypothetical protein
MSMKSKKIPEAPCGIPHRVLAGVDPGQKILNRISARYPRSLLRG